MKNIIWWLIVILGTHFSMAQEVREQDTIYLSEVVVTQHRKDKLKRISNPGKAQRVKFSSVMSNTLYANRIKIDKCIKIEKVVFYARKKQLNTTYGETFELLFFSVGSDGYPNERLHAETLVFQLFTEDKIEINLAEVSLPLCGEFFIALQKTMNKGATESNYIILGNNHKKSQTFVKIKEANWHKVDTVNLMLDIFYTESKKAQF